MRDSELRTILLPEGFRFGSARAGVKASGNPDLACAVADQAAAAAALFTRNRVVAAPVLVGRRRMREDGGRVRTVVVNAGNANCATGQAGVVACEQVCAAAAERFGCDVREVFPSSTGVIGAPLPAEKIIAALAPLAQAVAATPEGFLNFAQAIMTTDTRPKIASVEIKLRGGTVRLAGAAKGAGMIHPQLEAPHATMLAYLFTDAAATPEQLQPLLAAAADESFNRISVDGDTSTNDTVLLLAGGASGVPLQDDDAEAFARALKGVCLSLAKQIVADAEGVTHVVELRIRGADSDADALRAAKALAHSPLVKTAWAGSDPNWGRLVAALGYSGAALTPERIAIWIEDHPVCRNGQRAAEYDEAAAHRLLSRPEVTISIDLGVGEGSCRFWTTDLTGEYVRINADYST